MQSYLLFCKSDEGSEVFRAIKELEAPELEFLIADVNEQLSEVGIAIQAVDESGLRQSDKARWQSMRRKLDEWSYDLAQFDSGNYPDLPEVYPARYQAWHSAEHALQYVVASRDGNRRHSSTTTNEAAGEGWGQP